jgi:hypothetical protein
MIEVDGFDPLTQPIQHADRVKRKTHLEIEKGATT